MIHFPLSHYLKRLATTSRVCGFPSPYRRNVSNGSKHTGEGYRSLAVQHYVSILDRIAADAKQIDGLTETSSLYMKKTSGGAINSDVVDGYGGSEDRLGIKKVGKAHVNIQTLLQNLLVNTKTNAGSAETFDMQKRPAIKQFLYELQNPNLYSSLGVSSFEKLIECLSMLESPSDTSNTPNASRTAKLNAFSLIITDSILMKGSVDSVVLSSYKKLNIGELHQIYYLCMKNFNTGSFDIMPEFYKGKLFLRIIDLLVQGRNYSDALTMMRRIKKNRLLDAKYFAYLFPGTASSKGLDKGCYLSDLSGVISRCMAHLKEPSVNFQTQVKSFVKEVVLMFPNNDIDSIIFRSNICSALYYSITNSKNNSNSTNNSQSSFFIELVDFQIKNGMIVGSITLNSAAQLKFRQAKSGSESTAYLDIMELEKSYWYYHNIFRLEKPLQYEKAEKEGAKIVENARIASPSPSLMSLPSLAAYRHSQRAIFDDASFNATGPISLKDGSGHRLLYLGVSSASYISCAQGMSANLNSRAAGSGGKRGKQSANGGAFEEAQELGENVKSEGDGTLGQSTDYGRDREKLSITSGVRELLHHDAMVTGNVLDAFLVHKLTWLFSQSKHPQHENATMFLFVKRVLQRACIQLPTVEEARIANFIKIQKKETSSPDSDQSQKESQSIATKERTKIDNSAAFSSIIDLVEKSPNFDVSKSFVYDSKPDVGLDLLAVHKQLAIRDFNREEPSKAITADLHTKNSVTLLPTFILRKFYIEAIRTLQHSGQDGFLCLRLANKFLQLDIEIEDSEIAIIMEAFIKNNLFNDCLDLYKYMKYWGKLQSEESAHYMVQAIIGLRLLDNSVRMFRLLAGSDVAAPNLLFAQLLRYVLYQLTPTGRQFDYGEPQLSNKIEDVIPLFLELLPTVIRKTQPRLTKESHHRANSKGNGNQELVDHIVQSIANVSLYQNAEVVNKIIVPCISSSDPTIKEIGVRSRAVIDNIINYFKKSDSQERSEIDSLDDKAFIPR